MNHNILTVNSENLVRFIQRKRPQLGQVQILAIAIFLLLIPTTFIVAQNATGNFSMEGDLILDETTTQDNITTELIQQDQTGTQTNVSEEPHASKTQSTDIPEKAAPETNVTDNITDQNETQYNETQETPPTNETVNETTQNETLVTPPTVNETFEINVTINTTNQTETQDNESYDIIPNVTENITVNESADDVNVTINQTMNQTETPPEEPELYIEIFSPEKITRGETFSLEAKVSNTGNGTARDVVLYWILPDGFVILSGSGSVDCQEVAPQTSCWNNITTTASLSSIGNYDIRIRVSYSE
jgi:hypothetical protein